MYPILLNSKSFILYSYPLFMGLAWGLSFRLTQYQLERDKKPFKGLTAIFVIGFISAWIGAKVLFLAASGSGEFLKYSLNSNFWLGGGFVFYGGFIAGTSAILILTSKKFNVFPSVNLKYILPGLAFGHATGRIGCFLAGCCYGTETTSPLSIHLHNASRHPVQIYESISLILIGFYLWSLVKRGEDNLKVILSYLLTYSVVRFFLEFIRGDKIRGHILGVISTSQLISLFIFLIALGLLFRKQRR